MELLVVVAVIALLLAVLLPSLRKAKEMAGRIVCGNHERQLLTTNNLYANSWDEQYCPPMMVNGKMPDAPKPEGVKKPPSDYRNRWRKLNWLSNPDFRRFMALDDMQVSKYDNIMPDAFFCPADKVARYDETGQWNVLVSYGHNVTDWPDEVALYWPEAGTPSDRQWLIGHKRTAIPRASEKINFVDSTDWWATWYGANYVKGWDIVGHGNWEKYDAAGIWGPTLYRHNEGANIAFYDGHVEHMAKEKVFIDTDEDPSNATDEKDATGMWYVTWP